MPSYLRHTSTGDIYPVNPDLARRGDMEQVVLTAAQLKKALKEQKKRATKRDMDDATGVKEQRESAARVEAAAKAAAADAMQAGEDVEDSDAEAAAKAAADAEALKIAEEKAAAADNGSAESGDEELDLDALGDIGDE